MYAVAEPEDLTSLLEKLKIELQAYGHRLRRHECEVCFPGWDDTSDDDLSQEARVLLQKIPREIGGLELLGAAAQGDWCAAIGQVPRSGPRGKGTSTRPKNPRIALQADDGKGRHKAWMMLAKVAMHALDYDAKLISSPTLTELTRELQMMLDTAMCDILVCELEKDQQRLVQQPGCFGWLGARRLSSGDRAVAAYWATWDLHAKVIS